MKSLIMLACASLLAPLGALEAQPPPPRTVPAEKPVPPAGPVSLKPAKPHRVVDLRNGSFVIDERGTWVLNRSWRIENEGDIAPVIIDVVADGVELDMRGFEIRVGRVEGARVVTVVNVQGDDFTLKNGTVLVCCESGWVLQSTAFSTTILSLSAGGGTDLPLRFDGERPLIRDSRLGTSVFFRGSRGRIENTVISCLSVCISFGGDENRLLNSRIEPEDSVGVEILGNGNVVAGNLMDFAEDGPTIPAGFAVEGDRNIVRSNTVAGAGRLDVVFRVAGTGNVLDGNVAARTAELGLPLSVGIRFERDGNYYGDNRMQAQVPFDLGGTTQKDWDGNVGF